LNRVSLSPAGTDGRNRPPPALPFGTIDSFLHIPKTGGSTLRSVLARQYGLDAVLYCEPTSPNWPKGLSVLDFVRGELEQREIALITGHYPLGVHEYTRRPVRYFSMMRDPLDRELSNYYYAFNYQPHPFRKAILSGELPFDAFLARHADDPSASQLYLLAGLYPLRDDALAAANFNACRSLTALGVAERFDESLLFFAKQLGWRPPLYVRRNVTRLDDRKQTEREAMSRSAQPKAMQHLRADYALYGLANVLLNHFILSCGEEFRQAYGSFMELQDELSRIDDPERYQEYSFNSEAALPGGLDRYLDSSPYRTISRFLEQPLPSKAPPCNFAGYIERIDGQRIVGWAIDVWNAAPQRVEAWHNGRKVATALCQNVREDVKRAGYAKDRVGFRMELPENVTPAEVDVTFAGSPIALRRRVPA
jgi:hypothetical protein